jgi:hypothetical protein
LAVNDKPRRGAALHHVGHEVDQIGRIVAGLSGRHPPEIWS